MKQLGLLGLLFVLLLTACRKDADTTTIIDETPDPPTIEFEEEVNLIMGDVSGYIHNANVAPIEGATVTLNGQTTLTDEFGLFSFTNVEMNQLGEFIQVEKEDYFTGSRRFFPQDGAKSRVQIQLQPKGYNYEFNAETGGEIVINGDYTVSFTGDGVVLDDGTPYTGNVVVSAFAMNPFAPSTKYLMPGNLQGVSLVNQEVALETYGMIAVEMETTTGEHLQLAEGHEATITMPVFDALLANAPAEIPLWAFHEDIGLWVEESTATLQEGRYVGKVSHFSFWNCDAPFPLINIDFTLVDIFENTLPYRVVQISTPNSATASGYSNNAGLVWGKVPADVALTMDVFDQCGNIVYTTILGTFSEDVSLGNIILEGDESANTQVEGILVDCDGNTIPNGLARVQYQGTNYFEYTTDGTFDFSFFTCPGTEELSLYGVDLDELLESAPVAVTPDEMNNVGEVSVCEQQLENYIEVTVDGVTQIYTGVTVDSNPEFTFIQVYSQMPSYTITTGFAGNMAGDHSGDNTENSFVDEELGWFIYTIFETYEVSQYDTKIVGTASGTAFNEASNTEVTISIVFDVNL